MGRWKFCRNCVYFRKHCLSWGFGGLCSMYGTVMRVTDYCSEWVHREIPQLPEINRLCTKNRVL